MIKSRMRAKVTPANTSGTTTPTAIRTVGTLGSELLSVVGGGAVVVVTINEVDITILQQC